MPGEGRTEFVRQQARESLPSEIGTGVDKEPFLP